MKKIINILTICVFSLVMVIPFIFTNRDKEAVSETDNRALADNPITASLRGTRYADAVNNYYNDRIGFRADLIDFNGRIAYQVFRQSPVEKVIIGQDGWLFYNSEKASDGASISQYMGTKTYSEEELHLIADNLVRTRDYLAERNCEFVLFIAPNKERVYSAYMPESYRNIRTSELCGTDQIIEYLRKNTDIRVVWPYGELVSYMDEHPDEPVYFHLDTHWNELGAYIGAKALLDELGIEIESADDISKSANKAVNQGDLRNMMAVDDWLLMEETGWQINGFPAKNTIIKEESFTGHWRYYNEDKDSRTLLVNRDSFATAMRFELGSSFNNVDLCHHESYTPDLIAEDDPDIFVYETVERYVDILKDLHLIPEEAKTENSQ